MPFKKGNQLYKKRKTSYIGKNNPFYGKKHKEESKERMGAKKGSIPWNKDKTNICSKETLQKMKDAKKDYIPWNKDKKGLQEAWNKDLTKETSESVAKYAKSLEGREFTPETRKKISDSRWEKNNPAWSGGTSKLPYAFGFTRKLKKQIAERDNFICQFCKTKNPEDFNIHHWNYNKLEIDPFYLVFTCRRCNAKLNYNREKWEKHFYEHQIKRGLKPNMNKQ